MDVNSKGLILLCGYASFETRYDNFTVTAPKGPRGVVVMLNSTGKVLWTKATGANAAGATDTVITSELHIGKFMIE